MTKTVAPKDSRQTVTSSSIAIQLPVLLIGTLLATLVVALFIIFFLSQRQLETQVNKQLTTIAQAQNRRFATLLEERLAFMRELAVHPVVQQAILSAHSYPDDDQTVLAQEAEVYGAWLDEESISDADFDFIGLINRFSVSSEDLDGLTMGVGIQDGFLVADWRGGLAAGTYTPSKWDQREYEWWQQIVQKGDSSYLSGPELTLDAPTVRSVSYAVPIYHPDQADQVIGALYSAMDVELFNDIVVQDNIDDVERSIWTNSAGNVLYAAPTVNEFNLLTIPITDSKKSPLVTGPTGTTYQFQAMPLVSTEESVNRLGWHIVTVERRADVLRPIFTGVIPALTIAGIIGFGLVGILFLIYIRPFVRDLSILSDGARAFLGERRLPPTLQRTDELGTFSLAFQEMSSLIQNQLIEQEHLIEQRTNKLSRQTRLLQAASRVAKAANASLDLTELMETTVNLIPIIFGYYHASIFLLDADKRYAIVRESTGEIGKILKKRPHMVLVDDKSFVGWAANQQKPRVVADVTEDGVHFNNPFLPDTRSEVALPLIAQGELLGVLDVQSKEQNAFSDEDVSSLQLMADQVAAAILNARTYARANKLSEQRHQIVQLGHNLNRLAEEQKILDESCQQLREQFDYDLVYIAKLDERQWRVVSANGINEETILPLNVHRPITMGLAGRVLREETMALVSVRDDSHASFYDTLVPAFKGEVAVPIYVGNKLYGVLGAYSYTPGELDVEDQELLTAAREAVGAALVNAQLLAQTEANLSELNYLYHRVTLDQDKGSNEGVYLPATMPTDILDSQLITAPLQARGRPIGEIEVEVDQHFLTETESLLTYLSDQIALTIENSRLFSQTQNRLKETDALYNIATLLNSTLEEDKLLHRIPPAINEMLPISQFAISKWDQEQGLIHNINNYILGDKSQKLIEPLPDLPLSQFPNIEHMLNAGKISVCHKNDPTIHPSEKTHLHQTKQKTVIQAPLQYGDEILNILFLYRDDTLPDFTDRDLRLVQTISNQIAISVNNARLATKTNQQVQQLSVQQDQLQTAAQIAAAASAILNIEDLLNTSVSLIQDSFGLAQVNLYLVSSDTKELTLSVTAPENGEMASAQPNELVIQAANTDQAKIVNNPQNPSWKLLNRVAKIEAEAALPLRVRGDTIGVLDLQTQTTNLFTKTFEQTLQTIADQLAVAIDNAHLLADTRHVSEQLQIAAEVANAASTDLSLDSLLWESVERIRERFNLYYVGIFLRDESGFAVLRAGSGTAGKTQVEAGHKLHISSDGVQQSMIGKAIASSQPIVEQNVAQAPVWAPNPLLPETSSELALPLRSRGNIIGALTAQSVQVNGFPQDDIKVLQTLADQFGVAIENAQLFSETERGFRLQANLYEISQQIAKAKTPNEIFKALVAFASKSELVDVAGIFIPIKGDARQLKLASVWHYKFGIFPEGHFAYDAVMPPGTLLSTHEITTIEDSKTDPRISDAARVQYEINDMRTAVLVPLFVSGKWEATYVLARSTPTLITEKDLQFFLTLAEQATVILSSQRLYQETEGLYQVSRSLARTLTLEDALDSAVSAVHQYVNAAQTRFVIYDEQTQEASVVAEAVSSELFNKSFIKLEEDTLATQFQNESQPVLIYESDSEVESIITNHLRPFEAKMSYIVPAFYRAKLFGYMAIDSQQSFTPFDESSKKFVQAVVEQLTRIIENFRLLDDTMRHAQNLVQLNQFGTHITNSLRLEELVKMLQQQMSSLIPHDLFLLALYQKEPAEIQPLCLSLQNNLQETDSWRLDQADALTQFLAQNSSLVISNNHPISQSIATQLNLPSMATSIWVPLQVEEAIIGFFTVQSNQTTDYGEDELQLARGIANQTSLAINNARLFQRTQDNIEELRKLLHISQAASSSIDAQERIENSLSALSENLPNSSFAIYIASESNQPLTKTQSIGTHPFPQKLPPDSIPNWQNLFNGSAIETTGTTDDTIHINGHPSDKLYRIIMPLLLGERFIGVVDLISQDDSLFDEQNKRLLITLTGSLATTIESGRLFTEIEAANEELLQMDQLKTQFLANMSHELRTPLNSIIGFSRIILKGIDGPITSEQEEDLESIHSSGQHLLRLINDILDMSKIEARKMALVFDKVNLPMAAKLPLDTVRPIANGKGVELKTDYEENLPTIDADMVRVRQILMNLLSNAVKFTDKGKIVLKMRRLDKDFVQISVSDTGRGIPKESFELLFRPFEQVDSSSTREVGGTGLGLPISDSLAKMHGGRISIKSEVGVGSTFHVMLPIVQEEKMVTQEME